MYISETLLDDKIYLYHKFIKIVIYSSRCVSLNGCPFFLAKLWIEIYVIIWFDVFGIPDVRITENSNIMASILVRYGFSWAMG